jgi:hypothetical protein
MKASRLSSILFVSTLFCSLPTFAGNTIKKSVHFDEAVTVQGVQLNPGDYKFEWSGPGPDVQLNILHNGGTVTTVPAHMVQESASHNQTGYALKPGPDGGQTLSDVFFSGEKYDLQIGQNNGSGGSGNPSGSGSSQ